MGWFYSVVCMSSPLALKLQRVVKLSHTLCISFLMSSFCVVVCRETSGARKGHIYEFWECVIFHWALISKYCHCCAESTSGVLIKTFLIQHKSVQWYPKSSWPSVKCFCDVEPADTHCLLFFWTMFNPLFPCPGVM